MLARSKNPSQKSMPFDLTLYTDLLWSYGQCLKNKAQVKKTSFHFYHESNLHKLTEALQKRTYRPWKSQIFVVKNPKPREVIAAHMRDRVVHHLLYRYMSPFWERLFVPNSYASREGKGPLQAVADLRSFMRHYHRHRGPLYYLKVDVQSFFASIDLNVLQAIVEKHLSNDFYLWLFKVTLWHRATDPGNYELRSPMSDLQLIPRYKSLFHVPRDKGLPIGNLTSQFCANIYLNELDQFISHHLTQTGVVYWQRYVDDLVLLSPRKDVLVNAAEAMQQFLRSKLSLSLNPLKTSIQPVSAGIDHLGYFIKPDHMLVRRRVVDNFKRTCLQQLMSKSENPNELMASANSFLGYFCHADSYGLRRAAVSKILSHRNASPRLSAGQDFKKLTLSNDPDAGSSVAEKERQLRKQFEVEFVNQSVDGANCQRYMKNWRPMADFGWPGDGPP